jgi:hypothetical protein
VSTINPTYNNRVEYSLQHKEYGSLIVTEPIGWRTDGKEFVRSKKKHGVFYKFSNNLKFIEDGADFIRIIRKLYGIETDLRLVRKEKHPKTDVWTKSYDGFLDLSTFSIQNKQVSIKFNSSGLEQLIKSRESEKVEIERTDSIDGDLLSDLSTQTIENKARRIFLRTTFNGEDESTKSISNHKGFGGKTIDKISPFPTKRTTRSHSFAFNPIYSPNFDEGEDDSISAAHCFILDVDRERTLKMKFDLSFIVSALKIEEEKSREKLELRLVTYSDGLDFNVKNIEFSLDIKSTGVFNDVVFERTLNLKKGDSVSLHFFSSAKLGGLFDYGHWSFNYTKCNSEIIIEEDSSFSPTPSKIILAKELGQRLLEIITGKSDILYSELLGRTDLGYDNDGIASMTGFSHGHWIRGFDKLPVSDENKYKPFSTSFKDYLENLIALWNVGLGIEKVGYKERIIIEDLKYFYGNFVAIKLPNRVKKLKRSEAKEYYYSSLDIGYSKGWDNEEAMGLDEYNAKSNFLTNITKLKNTYTKISKYIAASYAKEFIRRKPKEDYPTEDHRNDKEIFVMDLKRGVNGFEERLWQDDFTNEPTGVFSPETATNLRFSPLNIILRHSWVLASGLLKYATRHIKFGSSEGNSNLKTKLNNGLEYSENGNIINSELQRPRYIPEWIEFEHEVNFEINQSLEGTTKINGRDIPNVYGLIEFINDENEIEKGYLFSLKPNGSGKWKILKANRQ